MRQGVCCLQHVLARAKITCSCNEQELQLAGGCIGWSIHWQDCAPSTAEDWPGVGRAVPSKELQWGGKSSSSQWGTQPLRPEINSTHLSL